MTKTIKEFSVEELKALAWDTLVSIEQGQNNLKLINQELADRAKPVEAPEEKKGK